MEYPPFVQPFVMRSGMRRYERNPDGSDRVVFRPALCISLRWSQRHDPTCNENQLAKQAKKWAKKNGFVYDRHRKRYYHPTLEVGQDEQR